MRDNKSPVQGTVAIVKPHAQARGLHRAILQRAVGAGLQIVHEEIPTLSLAHAEAFYAEHRGKSHFARITENLASGPVTIALLVGPDAIACWRTLLGPTDPAAAPAGTIRGDFGEALPANAAHGSDAQLSALREADLFMRRTPARFGDDFRAIHILAPRVHHEDRETLCGLWLPPAAQLDVAIETESDVCGRCNVRYVMAARSWRQYYLQKDVPSCT